jgi:hypothetical protein
MTKKISILFILTVFIPLIGCVHRASPPKAETEFLLTASKSEAVKTEKSGDGLEKKKAVYHALNGLSTKNNIVIIYDASGSMREKISASGPKKFEAAYEGLKQIGTLFQPGDQVKLFVFGSKKPSGITNEGTIPRKDYARAVEASGDVELIYNSPREGFNQKEFLATTRFLGTENTYIGDTPIGYSVLKAHQTLKGTPNAKVILITDGLETGPILSQHLSKDKTAEDNLRKKYLNYNELTIAASDAIKKLVEDHIHFSPILYGLKSSASAGSKGEKENQSIREFYSALAKESGSASLEATTPLELLNAFMDAEMMSLTYGLYPLEGDKKNQPAATGKIGISLMAEEGKYLLKTNTEQPLQQEVELKAKVKNIYFLDMDKEGKLKILREDLQ